jgi:NTE family protein
MIDDNSKRIAMVIGAGSVKCAAAIGLQNVLAREGIELDMVVGCSAGSMYAAVIAAGHDGATAAEMSQRLWTRELTGKRNRLAMLRAMLPGVFGFDENFGVRDDRLVMQRLREAYGELRFSDTRIPLHITATDFRSGEQVVFSSGSIVDAIRASISIPYVFKPWHVDGKLLIDGFMSDPLPVNVAIREGARVIVAMGFESPYQSNINSFGRFSFQLSSIMTNNLLKSRFAFNNLAHHAEVILIMPEFDQRIRLFDTGKIPSIIEAGERAAELQLPYIRRLLDTPAEITEAAS